MARRRKYYVDRRSSDSQERWLVSYADFITLLFALFVVLYAVSSVSEAKYRKLSDALGTAFGTGKPTDVADVGSGAPIAAAAGVNAGATSDVHGGATPGEGGGSDTTDPALRNLVRGLTDALTPLLDNGEATVSSTPRGVSIELNASAVFNSGNAQLTEASRRKLAPVAAVLAHGNLPIQVEGHTDDRPVAGTQFPSNWELSAARAASVLRVLADGGVDPRRLVAKGYAEYQPLESNATASGRARNRRVVLTVLALEGTAPAEARVAAELTR